MADCDRVKSCPALRMRWWRWWWWWQIRRQSRSYRMCCIETDTIILTQFNSALLTSVRSGRAEPGRVGSGLVCRSGLVASGPVISYHSIARRIILTGRFGFIFPKLDPWKTLRRRRRNGVGSYANYYISRERSGQWLDQLACGFDSVRGDTLLEISPPLIG